MKEDIVLQPKQVSPSGVATIELFDEAGEVVQRERKHNFFQQRILESTAKVFAYNGFDFNVYNRRYFMESLILTDFAGAPDANAENFIRGNPVGWGERGSSGGGGFMGTYNDLESVWRQNYVKLVFDFATSQANGTFQSVYTAFTDDYSTGDSYYQEPIMLLAFNTPFTFTELKKKNNVLYFMRASEKRINKVSVLDLAVFGGSSQGSPSPTISNEEIIIPTTVSIRSMTIKGTDVYYLSSNSRDVYKAPLSNPGAFSLVKTFTKDLYQIDYDESSDRFFFIETTTRLMIADSNLTELSVTDGYSSLNSTSPLTVMKDGKTFLNSTSLHEIETKKRWSSGVQSYAELGMFSLGHTWSGNSNTSCYLYAAPMFTSRALLDSPVTKTSQNTMKITYEFTLPTLNIPIV